MSRFSLPVAAILLLAAQARAETRVGLRGVFPDGTTITVGCHEKNNTIVGGGKIRSAQGQELQQLHIFSGSYAYDGTVVLNGRVAGSRIPFQIRASSATGRINLTFSGLNGPSKTATAQGKVIVTQR